MGLWFFRFKWDLNQRKRSEEGVSKDCYQSLTLVGVRLGKNDDLTRRKRLRHVRLCKQKHNIIKKSTKKRKKAKLFLDRFCFKKENKLLKSEFFISFFLFYAITKSLNFESNLKIWRRKKMLSFFCPNSQSFQMWQKNLFSFNCE